jgi:hypothetical protein
VAHLLARGPPDGAVGRDDANLFPVPVLGGQALENIVGVRGVTDLQGAE